MQKASMGARIGALFLDGLILSAIYMLCYFLLPNELYVLVTVFGYFLYFGICEGSPMSATLGKKICGIVVLDEHGNKLSGGKGFLRSLCRVVSGMILGIGFIIALFDKDYRALHDRMAKTFVAKAVPLPLKAPAPAPPQTPEQRSDSTMNGIPQIIGVAGQFAGKAFRLPPQGAMLGRDSASCEFAFPDSTQGISRNHCKVVFNPQTQMFVLYDLGSSYGTFLGSGTKVAQGQPIALRSGEEFYLASRVNLFRVSL